MFPDLWKVDKISPIHKSGDVTNPGNYRPVLPAVSIILEYCMGVKTATDPSALYLTVRLPIPTLLPYCTHQICLTSGSTNLNNGLYTGVALIDYSKAFDTIYHSIPLKSSRPMERIASLRSNLSYLTDRSQEVFFNGHLSSPCPISAGVPQGSSSILNPLFPTDLPEVIADFFYCDDDTTFVAASKFKIEVLSSAMGCVNLWANCNENSAKTKCSVITSQHAASHQKQGCCRAPHTFG